jgi:hypothetical protein
MHAGAQPHLHGRQVSAWRRPALMLGGLLASQLVVDERRRATRFRPPTTDRESGAENAPGVADEGPEAM